MWYLLIHIMKISFCSLLFFTALALCSTKTSTCESFRWLESKGKGSCDFKTDICGWKNYHNWKVDYCDIHYRKCCFVKMKNVKGTTERLKSPHLCGTEDVSYIMKLRCDIPRPDIYTLAVYLTTRQSSVQLWQSDNKTDFSTEEVNFTLPQLQFQITIEGKRKSNNWDTDQSIQILDVSFHQTNIAGLINRESTPSRPVVAKTTISDNGNVFRTSDASMTTTTTSMTKVLTSLSANITPFSFTDNTTSATTFTRPTRTALVSKNTSTENKMQPGVTPGNHTNSHTQSANSTSGPVAAAVAGAVIAVLISIITAAVLIRRKTKDSQNLLTTVNTHLPVNTEHGHDIPCAPVRSDPENCDYVQDPTCGKPCAPAGGTGLSTLVADDIYNHTQDSDNKQLGRHGEGGGGIYSTLATEDTYSHLQGKEHNRFDRQGHGKKNPHLTANSDDDYHHL